MNEMNGHETAAVATTEGTISIELTLPEAASLRAWLLKPVADGSTALDDALVNVALKKVGAALDRVEAVADIRGELEEAGFETSGMSDEQVAELGRKIGQVSQRGLR
jgi:hypothetical protein